MGMNKTTFEIENIKDHISFVDHIRVYRNYVMFTGEKDIKLVAIAKIRNGKIDVTPCTHLTPYEVDSIFKVLNKAFLNGEI